MYFLCAIVLFLKYSFLTNSSIYIQLYIRGNIHTHTDINIFLIKKGEYSQLTLTHQHACNRSHLTVELRQLFTCARSAFHSKGDIERGGFLENQLDSKLCSYDSNGFIHFFVSLIIRENNRSEFRLIIPIIKNNIEINLLNS